MTKGASIIGRVRETRELNALYESGRPELVAVFGRRRVGKTYLVDETFKGRITLRHAGLSPADPSGSGTLDAQLEHFYHSLRLQGYGARKRPRSWLEAFFLLEQHLEQIDDGSRQLVFIDELPWLDTSRKPAWSSAASPTTRGVSSATSASPRTWAPSSSRRGRGFAFEDVCFNHIDQIKAALGIGGVATTHSAWSEETEDGDGVQVDLLISRNDNVVNMCEAKFYSDDFTVTKSYYRQLLRRQEVFAGRISPKAVVHSTLVTTFGLKRNGYSGAFANVVTLDDLFE